MEGQMNFFDYSFEDLTPKELSNYKIHNKVRLIELFAGLEYIMRVMDVVGVDRFQDLKGKYVRVAHKGLGSSVKIIGNITKEKWVDAESFFKDKKENADD